MPEKRSSKKVTIWKKMTEKKDSRKLLKDSWKTNRPQQEYSKEIKKMFKKYS
jgi:hypothetical protein